MSINRDHARLMRRATATALATAILLALSKAVAWWLSGSVSLLAGLTDSLLDGAASLLNLLAVHYSLRPADDDHRYGHGKAEALAGLGQAAFICVSAILVGVQGVDRLLHPQPLGAQGVGIAVMIFSLVMTAVLLTYQHHVVKITGSTAVRADSLHYRSDLLLNSSILLALVLASFGWERTDALFGIAIAFYIFWSAISIVREAGAVLMDTELSPEISEQMQQLVCEVPGYMVAMTSARGFPARAGSSSCTWNCLVNCRCRRHMICVWRWRMRFTTAIRTRRCWCMPTRLR